MSGPKRGTRRRYLRALCSVGSGALLAGCPSTAEQQDPDETPTPEGETPESPTHRDATTPEPDLPPIAEEFETAVNVVDAGVDPDGSTPLRPALDLEDDTLLYFPEGRYRLDGEWDFSSVADLALVGDGAVIVPPAGYRGNLLFAGDDPNTRSLYVSGLTFDSTGPDTGARPINVRVKDRLVVEDVVVNGTTRVMRFEVVTPDGSGTIRRLQLPDGGFPLENQAARKGKGEVGCLVTPNNRGELRFVDCYVEGFADNGLYASPSRGPIEVLRGTYANNGIANVRVSGPGRVRNVTVRCTRAPQGFPANMRGIWARGGRCTVENCDVRLHRVTGSAGAIVTESGGLIRDSRIRIDADDVPGIHVYPATGSTPEPIRCTEIDVVGSASNGSAVLVRDRDDCTFDGFTVTQTGADRDGFHLIRSRESIIRDTSIAVTGDPLVFEESEVATEDVTVTDPDTEAPDRLHV